MMKKSKREAHVNHERWLVSYADFVTLLFAFFVVMFASSTMDKGRAQQVSDSVKRAIEESTVAAKVSALLGREAKRPKKSDKMAPVAELSPSLKLLTRELAAEVLAGKIKLSLESRGLVVSLPQATYFPSGQDTIDSATFPSLAKIARVVRELPNSVRLEGHTDSEPIHTPRFRSNWELSAARSVAMLELLTTQFEVSSSRLTIAGYAENVPVSSNETPEGRAQNRRVDLVILNQNGMLAEPAAELQKPRPASAPQGK
jgi:chemotaxis protein MotB